MDPPMGASDEIPAALKEEEATHIFENYSFDHTYSPDLPITCYRQQIVDTIESNSVTIVQGVLISLVFDFSDLPISEPKVPFLGLSHTLQFYKHFLK